MDLNQSKLTKSEWESIERPVDKDEMKIIKLISNGFHNTDIKYNENESGFPCMFCNIFSVSPKLK